MTTKETTMKTTYRVIDTATHEELFRIRADWTQAAATIAVNYGASDKDWCATQYQVAAARHEPIEAAQLIVDDDEDIEGGTEYEIEEIDELATVRKALSEMLDAIDIDADIDGADIEDRIERASTKADLLAVARTLMPTARRLASDAPCGRASYAIDSVEASFPGELIP